MGNLHFGNTNTTKVYFGNTEVSKIYYGSTLIYQNVATYTMSISRYSDGCGILPANGYTYTSGSNITLTITPDFQFLSNTVSIFDHLYVSSDPRGLLHDIANHTFANYLMTNTYTLTNVTSNITVESVYDTGSFSPITWNITNSLGTTVTSAVHDVFDECAIRIGSNVRDWTDVINRNVKIAIYIGTSSQINFRQVYTVNMIVPRRLSESTTVVNIGTGTRRVTIKVNYSNSGFSISITTGSKGIVTTYYYSVLAIVVY